MAGAPAGRLKPIVARDIEAMHAARQDFVLDAVFSRPSKLFEPVANRKLEELGVHVEGAPFKGLAGPHRPRFGNVTFLRGKEQCDAGGAAKILVVADGCGFNGIDTRRHLATVFGSEDRPGPVPEQDETLVKLL